MDDLGANLDVGPPAADARRKSLASRLSFAAATRLRLRRLSVPAQRGCLSLTFDDIPRSAWTSGGAILRRHGLRATFYLSGDLCGKTSEGREQYCRADVDEMVAEGHEIGSHLYHHVSTLTLGPRQLRHEIAANDAFLKAAIGLDFLAQSFAYPFGEISVAAKWQCSRRFQTARSVMPGVNRTGVDADQLHILPIDNIFADQTDWTTILDTVAQDRAWAIVLAHGVDDTGHPYSCPPDRLEALVQRAIAAGLDILPVSDVMQRQAQR